MIAKFWDALFAYGDMLREQGREADHKVIEDVYDILQKAYDNGVSAQVVIRDKTPSSPLEAFVLSIKDITVYQEGNEFYYDLDGHHFDTPEEVMNYLVNCRYQLQLKAIAKVRREALEFMMSKLNNIEISNIVEKSSPKTVVKAPLSQKLTISYLRKEMIDKGKTAEQVAKMVGCSESTVQRYVMKYGINKEINERKKK